VPKYRLHDRIPALPQSHAPELPNWCKFLHVPLRGDGRLRIRACLQACRTSTLRSAFRRCAQPFIDFDLSSINGISGAPSLRFLQGWVAILFTRASRSVKWVAILFTRASRSVNMFHPHPCKVRKGGGTHLFHERMGERAWSGGPPVFRIPTRILAPGSFAYRHKLS